MLRECVPEHNGRSHGAAFLEKGMEACSAGWPPWGIFRPLTLEVLNEAGIPTDGLHSKGIAGVRFDDIDYLVDLAGLDLDGLIPPVLFRKADVS